MKKQLLILVASIGLTAGCVVSIGGKHETPPPAPAPTMPPGPPPTAAETATIAEIDAATRLSFDNQRLEALSRIARRPDLGTAPLTHLVHAAYRSLSFDNQKVELLKLIVANPGFNDATRHAIVSQLQRLSFDNQRQEILAAIDRRLQAPAVP